MKDKKLKQLNSLKILLLGFKRRHRYNWGHELFREEIARQHKVIFYGEGYDCDYDPKLNIFDILSIYGEPDFILVHYEHRNRKGPYERLGEVTNIPKVHIAGDYLEKNQAGYNRAFKSQKYDLVFAFTRRWMNEMKKNKVADKIYTLPFCVDTNIYQKFGIPKIIDVMTSSSVREDKYPNRKIIAHLVEKMNIVSYTKRIYHEDYIKHINKSKIFVVGGDIDNCLCQKFTEVLACGTFLLTDKPEDFDFLGYQDKNHLIVYKDFSDLKNKIYYFLKHEDYRESIAKTGMEFVRKNHSAEVRVKEFIQIVREKLF